MVSIDNIKLPEELLPFTNKLAMNNWNKSDKKNNKTT